MKLSSLVSALALCVEFTAAPASAYIFFEDGQVHLIDASSSLPQNDVIVRDSATLMPTTLIVSAGAEINTLSGFDGGLFALGTSIARIDGGDVGGFAQAHHDARLEILSGHADGIAADSQASILMTGGLVDGPIPNVLRDSATLDFQGGDLRSLALAHSSFAEISGGLIRSMSVAGAGTPADLATFYLTGGTIGIPEQPLVGIFVNGFGSSEISGGTVAGPVVQGQVIGSNPTLDISGGTIQGDLTVQAGRIHWRGGSVGDRLEAFIGGSLLIYGTDFSHPFGEITDSFGTLTGTLADGTPINNAYARLQDARIHLRCPAVGAFSTSTPALGADQNNYCEDWRGVVQFALDLSRSNLGFVDLTGAIIPAAVFVGTDLAGADLTDAFVVGADWMGALYDEETRFPSGGLYDAPPWDLDGSLTPWDAGMIPVPEAEAGGAFSLMSGISLLAGLRRRWRRRRE